MPRVNDEGRGRNQCHLLKAAHGDLAKLHVQTFERQLQLEAAIPLTLQERLLSPKTGRWNLVASLMIAFRISATSRNQWFKNYRRRLIGRFDGVGEMHYVLMMNARPVLSLPSQRDSARVRHAHEDWAPR